MENKNHPHYLNPSIIEAVLEIRLDIPLIIKDNEKIDKVLGSKYSIEKDEIVIYTASINPLGATLQPDKPGLMRLKFNISEKIFVQIYPDRCSFHWVGKYPGWNIFQKESEKFWKELCEALPHIAIKQVGIRFINKIDQKKENQKVGYWLKSSSNYPKSILSVYCDYFYKGKWPLKIGRWAQICIAEAEVLNHKRPLMFDIDIIQKIEKPLKLDSELAGLALDLHDEVYEIFESSISTNYKKILNSK